MKKLMAIAPAMLFLAACTTNGSMTNSNPVTTMTCQDNGQVVAAYAAKGQIANLNVTLPKVGINNKKITLNQAVSASGARYLNSTDPKMSYDWHTKADYGVMSVSMANGQKYSVNCKI